MTLQVKSPHASVYTPGAGPEEEIRLVTDGIVLEDMIVEETYEGPRMESDGEGGYKITQQFVKDMTAAFKLQKKLHRRFAFQILIEVRI